MKVLIQWTKQNAEGWVELDVRDTPLLRRVWELLPSKPLPVGGETLDNSPGWVFDINVQGIHFGGADHYAVQYLTDPTYGFGLRITTWQDDPDDGYGPGHRTATEWVLFDPRPDPLFGGAINTVQRRRFWAEDRVRWPDALVWSTWVQPPNAITRHGIWVPDAKVVEHYQVRGPVRGWREWIT